MGGLGAAIGVGEVGFGGVWCELGSGRGFRGEWRTGCLGLILVFVWNGAELSFWWGDWALGYHFVGCSHFSDISYFHKILSLMSFHNSSGNSYIPCL